MLDPTSRFKGGEENKAEDSTRYVEALEIISAQTGAAVLATNHANKVSMRDGDADAAYATRGSSAQTDGVRLQTNLFYSNRKELKERGIHKREHRLYLQLSIPKSNYTRPFEPCLLRRDPDTRVLAVVELPSAGEVAAKDTFDRVAPQALKLLQEHPDEFTLRQFCARFGRGGRYVSEIPLGDSGGPCGYFLRSGARDAPNTLRCSFL